MTNFTLDIDGDGIALITWDMPGRSMNVIDASVTEELGALVEKVASDAAIKGAVVTSGKDTFCGGADFVTDVWSAGRHRVRGGRHVRREAITARYRAAMARLRGRL